MRNSPKRFELLLVFSLYLTCCHDFQDQLRTLSTCLNESSEELVEVPIADFQVGKPVESLSHQLGAKSDDFTTVALGNDSTIESSVDLEISVNVGDEMSRKLTSKDTDSNDELDHISIDDIARWISGIEPRTHSVMSELISDTRWQKHAQSLDHLWSKSMEPTLKEMTDWSHQRFDPNDHRPVFYPFSGPDILNALHLYPFSHDYLMLALEDEGLIPTAPTLLDKETLGGLGILRSYVSGHILRNFFITHEMLGKTKKAALGDHPYTGVGSVILFFLVRSGYEIRTMRYVTLSPSGRLKTIGHPSELVPPQLSGIEITFRGTLNVAPKTSESAELAQLDRRVIFLRANVSDTNLSEALGLIPFILSYGEFNSLVKAASYLMHYSNFDSIRNMLLSRSYHLITDDTGIPFHFLNESVEGWNIELYGKYMRPNPSSKTFTKHCQPDLKSAMKTKAPRDLPFRFGYYLKQPHLILATRKSEIYEPQIDFDLYQGMSTVYRGDSRCLKGKQHIISRKEPRK